MDDTATPYKQNRGNVDLSQPLQSCRTKIFRKMIKK